MYIYDENCVGWMWRLRAVYAWSYVYALWSQWRWHCWVGMQNHATLNFIEKVKLCVGEHL